MTEAKINLRNAFVQEVGDTISHCVEIDIDELIEFSGLEQYEIDVTELLHDNEMIADVYHIEDVKNHCPDLNDQQCWEVLKVCYELLIADGEYRSGIIHRAAEQLYGSEQQRLLNDRVARINKTLDAYDNELLDLLADARHWCDAHEADFSELNHKAYEHYLAEKE